MVFNQLPNVVHPSYCFSLLHNYNPQQTAFSPQRGISFSVQQWKNAIVEDSEEMEEDALLFERLQGQATAVLAW